MSELDAVAALLSRKQAVERRLRADPDLVTRVGALKAWQAARLAQTYSDFARQPRYESAVRFFLEDLYGPQDHSQRERDFERAWRYFKRTLPAAALAVLERAMRLDVLSAELDELVASNLSTVPLSMAAYAAAYRRADRETDRRSQIDLLVGIAEDLDRVVGSVWIAAALKAAHVPAHAAGFGALQGFLERGFAAFRRMQGARDLRTAIREREARFLESILQREAHVDE
jgi:hypothetical protein